MPPAEPTPNRRRWFQLHLSTCVVLMFVAGGLMWANLRPQKVVSFVGDYRFRMEAVAHGWPLVFWQVVYVDSGSERKIYAPNIHAQYGYDVLMPKFGVAELLVNIVVALVVCALTAAHPYWIRRTGAPAAVSEQPWRFWQIHLSTLVLIVIGAGLVYHLNRPQSDISNGLPIIRFGWPQEIIAGRIGGGDYEFWCQDNWPVQAAVFVDELVALAIISALALPGEWLMRRRERRRP